MGQLLLPLFSHRDRRQTEFFCYSDVRVRRCESRRSQGLADQWRETVELGDPELADRIRGDRIDILVDLALHTAHNRMLVFARKPAPVQVTMLGLPATTGLTTIGYRLTDPYLDPPGASDADYSEQSIRLPHCFWSFNRPTSAAGRRVSRAQKWLCHLWLPESVRQGYRSDLELWVEDPSMRTRLAAGPSIAAWPSPGCGAPLFSGGGRCRRARRVHAKVPRLEYLHRYQDLDVCLDPFPYNGHTSTLDALWMGVPVITLAGRTAWAVGA